MSNIPSYAKHLRYKGERRTIELSLPRISFRTDSYNRGNAWGFLGWLLCTLLGLCGIALVAMIIAFWGSGLYKKATAPAPKVITKYQDRDFNARQSFVKNCEVQQGVPNVGSKWSDNWTCKKL